MINVACTYYLNNLQALRLIVISCPSQLIIQKSHRMVFYGIKSNIDAQFQKLDEEISVLVQKREVINQNNLTTLHKEFGLSTLANGAGRIFTQSILSSQYVLGCIGDYFKREWTQPALYALSPIISEYQKLPLLATELKCSLAKRYSVEQRLTTVLLATSLICAKNLTPQPLGLLVASGKVMATFGGLSFLLLPQLGKNIANAFLDWLQ